MASFFTRIATKRVIGGVAAGGVGLGTAQQYSNQKQVTINRDAEAEFNKSFGYKDVVRLPEGYPPFQIKNQYPTSKDIPKYRTASDDTSGLPSVPLPGPDQPLPSVDPINDAPWLKVDFREDPMEYCRIIKTYCWSGNVNHDFNIHENKIRPWYHAPWMHWDKNGREPINGLTFERPLQPGELSKDQNRVTQSWAIGFYNWMGATVFGDMWQDPSNPKWDNHIKFPLGTCVFKILMTEATEKEVPSLKGAPTLKAVIATVESAEKERPDASVRKTEPDDLRLLQVDFAVRDDRIPVGEDGNGWVFGTFMYDGSKTKEANPWDRIIPVGIMWGNDPKLTPEASDNGETPKQSWINPEADRLLQSLGGTRAKHGWGAGKRLNGPVDNFVSACSSCHSTAERNYRDKVDMIPPKKPDDPKKVPEWSKNYMRWFRNLGPGESFSGGEARSADYSLQLMSGYNNYKKWRGEANGLTHKLKVVIPYSKARQEEKVLDAKRDEVR